MHASQCIFIINVWDDIVEDCLLGPYILPEELMDWLDLYFIFSAGSARLAE